MHPVLFELDLGSFGRLTIGTYGLFYAVGFLLALRLGVSYARREGIEAGRIVDLGIVSLLAGFVGAKLLLYVIDARYYLDHPFEMVRSLRSAGVFYGGLALAAMSSVWYVRRHHLPLGKVADLAAPALALGQGIGRLGCFAAGCCYGKNCDWPWAVTFTEPRAYDLTQVPLGVPLHPTQLYHAAADALILLVTMGLMRRRRFAGQVFWAYLLLYSLLRFLVEFWRGDSARGLFLGGAVSTSQIISIPVAVLSLSMLIVLSRRARAAAAAGSPVHR
ncbi:MAG TPA: prolipoprotein diacylglyceryl transferase [Candidatus Cryosericum sp.]|nr:prolipoprotein diacylglyceryl transferase [Candidatus Cryosericum sp.]